MTRAALPALLSATLLISACGAPDGGGGSAMRLADASGGACPSPDPVRDGPLVDAIRLRDATSIRTALLQDPADERARAALAIVAGDRPDPDEAACFAPYLGG